MTINLTDVTFDLLVAEQLHDIVPCSRKACGLTAHWVATCSWCGLSGFRCGPHKVQEDEWISDPRPVNCRDCSGEYPRPFPWVAL